MSSYLFILVGSYGDKFSFFKNVGTEGWVGKFQNIVGADEVKPGLVLVHWIQDRLEKKKHEKIINPKIWKTETSMSN